jgi:hypothetical protein
MTIRSVALSSLAWVAGGVTAGYALLSAIVARSSPSLLPWVLGRGLGIAAYVALAGLTAIGLWLRHPWRMRRAVPHAASAHHAHSLLAAVFLLLTVGHVVALAVDRFAGVGWAGVVVPGAATYRPLAVALGSISLYLGLAIAASASLAGWVGRRVWLPIHRVASGLFALVWLHAVLAGSDAVTLRPLYLVTGAAVTCLAVTRRLATAPKSMMITKAQPEGASR